MKKILFFCFYLIIFFVSVPVEATDNNLVLQEEAKSIPLKINEIEPQDKELPQKPVSTGLFESLPPVLLRHIALEFLSLKEVSCLRIANKNLLNKLDDVFKKKLKAWTEKIIREEYYNSLNSNEKNLKDHKTEILDFCPLEMLRFVYGEEAELLRACLLLYSEKYEEGFEMLNQTKGLPEVLQPKFNNVVYNNSYKFFQSGEISFNWKIGKKYLLKRAGNGDTDAQKYLNDAAYNCVLGFNEKTGKEYLEERIRLGDLNAQKRLNEAAEDCRLGFKKKTARKYLEEQVNLGDEDVSKKLNEAAYDYWLGFDEETGRKYLEERAKKGDQDAQKWLNKAAENSRLGFNEETGTKYLEERAQKGDQDAQKLLNKAAYNCELGFNEETARKYLEERVRLEDQDAQEWLNEAAYSCELGFNKKTGKEYLDERAQKGDQDAQKLLNKDAYNCGVDFNEEIARKYLEERVTLVELV